MNTPVIGFNPSVGAPPTGVWNTPQGQQADHQRIATALTTLSIQLQGGDITGRIPSNGLQQAQGTTSEELIRKHGGEALFAEFEKQCETLGLKGEDREQLADSLLGTMRSHQALSDATGPNGEALPLSKAQVETEVSAIAASIPTGGANAVPTEAEAGAKGNVAALMEYAANQMGDSCLSVYGRVENLAKHDPTYATDPAAAREKAAGQVLGELRNKERFDAGIPPEPHISADGEEANFSNGDYNFKVTHGQGDTPPTVVITNRATGEETTVPCDMVDGAVRFEMENGTSIRIDTSKKEDGKVGVDSVVILDADEKPAYEIGGFSGEGLTCGEVSEATLAKLEQPAMTYFEQPGEKTLEANWINESDETLATDADDHTIGAPIPKLETADGSGSTSGGGSIGSEDTGDAGETGGTGSTSGTGDGPTPREIEASPAKLFFLDKFCEMFGLDFDVSVNGQQYHLGSNDSAPDGALNPDKEFKPEDIFGPGGMSGFFGSGSGRGTRA